VGDFATPPRDREEGKIKRDVLREGKCTVVAVHAMKAFRGIGGRPSGSS